MITIIRWELSRRKLYLLAWCVIIIGLTTMLMLVYPSIHQQAAKLNEVIKQLPASLQGLRGGNIDLASPVGYLNAQLFYITLPFLFVIMSVSLGTNLLGKDEQDHTLELLLSRPISRAQVLLGKALSGLILLFISVMAATIVTSILSEILNMGLAIPNILLTGFCTFVFSVSFGAVAFALQSANKIGSRFSMGVAVALSFGGYITESLSSSSDFLKSIANLLPYHAYVPSDLLVGNLSKGFVFYMLGLYLASALLAYFGFRYRDID